MDMDYFEIISIVVAILTGILAAASSMLVRHSTKRNSNESEKLLFELKRVNDDVNHKIREVIENSRTSINAKTKTANWSELVLTDEAISRINDQKLDELIHNHHSQALSQSKIQFWFSLIAAVIGFFFIIIMVCLASTNQWYEYLVRILPGAIIEAVSVLFFSQSRETRERSSDFLNRLREDKQYEKGIAFAESISDEKLKSTLKAEIAMRLCGITDINLFENQKEQTKNVV